MMAMSAEFLSDILLGLGALAAAFYCVVLSRKLNRLSGLDQELGTAIAILSQQVDEMTNALDAAQTAAQTARDELGEMTARAEEVASDLQSKADHGAAPDAAAPEPADNSDDDCSWPAEGAPSLFVRHAQGAK